jgi:hypothetical protein
MADFTGRMIGAMQADVKILEEIEADPGALTQAVTVIAIAGVSALIGNILRGGLLVGIFALITSLLGYAVFALLVTLIGTRLMPDPDTKADFSETFRTVGFAAAPGVLHFLVIIPYLGQPIGLLIVIWNLVIGVVAVQAVLDYSSTAKAIIVCVLAAFAYAVLYSVVVRPIWTAIVVTTAG